MNDSLIGINLPLISVTIKVKVTRAIKWNSFPGSVIHGIIGYKLKDYSCVMAHRNCNKCFLVHSCAYGMIYESPVPPDSKRMKLYPQSPHPIRVAVYPWDKPELKEGTVIEIGLTLFGKTAANLLMVLLSLESGFEAGIGRKYQGERGKAEIISLSDNLSKSEKPWSDLKKNYVGFAHPVVINNDRTEISKIALHFKSPLKITTAGKSNYKPDFRDIIATLLRRASNLSYFFHDRELDLDYKGILQKAELLETVKDYSRVKAIRYSSRQSKTISISGVTGNLTINDCPPDLLYLLEVGQYTGLGKSTTMGLGDYELKL
ncbi:MAG: CRISPR system precrRNA processing endoribonuclease RAMP protein Cas6 [candidate division Zixibacteria bacterium]|nr:CRISPR system precrRNA processing endoribonuclease RAMP protein Cas6 [candidate division Zixibacteria bacterium]